MNKAAVIMMAILQLDKHNPVPSQAHEGTATYILDAVDLDYKVAAIALFYACG